MKDRVPGKAGRVLITPEDGSPAFYATMTRADEPTQAGDPLNKATLLADAVAKMYGLGTEVVPSDVFGYLGFYAQHQWFRKVVPSFEPAISETVDWLVIYDEASTTVRELSYYSTVLLDPNQKVIFPDEHTSIDIGYNVTSNIPKLRGKYISVGGQAYYVPSDAGYIADTEGNGHRIRLQAQAVYAKDLSAAGPDTYLHDSDENAYPHSGESGGYEYTYLGRPVTKLIHEPLRIFAGKYYGTGEYGAATPNRIEVPFKKVLALFVLSQTSRTFVSGGIAYLGQPGSSAYTVFTAFDGGLEWYGASASNQANDKDEWYHYVAIGIDSDREEN